MKAADPQEIEIGEEAMVARVMDGLNHEAILAPIKGAPGISSVTVDGLKLAAHGGEPVFQLDLSLVLESRGRIELPMPSLSRDKEALARRCRKFWRRLVSHHKG